MRLILKSVAAMFFLGLSLGFVACTEEEPTDPVDMAGDGSGIGEPGIVDEAPTEPMGDMGSMQDYQPENIYFAFDDFSLNMESQQKLNQLADFMKNDPGVVVQIQGHCDERGSIEYNLALGERRAQSVKNYLEQLGVDGSRLSTISYGEEKPAADGHNEEAWAQNRRAEFVPTR